MRKLRIITTACLVLVFFQGVSAQIPRPEEVLGFKVGMDRKPADMDRIIDYFQRLDEASDRVSFLKAGRTTLGNPFMYAIITSPENHENLEMLRGFQQQLADPRKLGDGEAEKIIARGKAVVMINCSLHATEIGASQMSMELAYDLASGTDPETLDILDNVILLLVPMHNPDGIRMVVDWYRKTLDTPYEGGSMPWLYHHYVGHDNNRDWYMFTQVESRLTVEKIHNVWRPHIVVDMHQMGSNGARLFIPPYVDPYEPNVDPILRQGVAVMGTFIASELTARGKSGVIHSHRFDAWTPARAYHHYHGGIRILTEAASVRLATPITVDFEKLTPEARDPSVRMPLPWPGGSWSLRDIVEYNYAAARAALLNAARLRENWLRNFHQVHLNAIHREDPPFAFVIPLDQKDPAAAVKMMQTLQIGDVEIHRAEEDFQADGRSHPQGSWIVFLAQPYGGYAKALLERQDYPEIREYPGGPIIMPYDVVAHTLPLLMGVEAVPVETPFDVKTKLMKQVPFPEARVETVDSAAGYAWGPGTNDDFTVLNRLMKKGYAVSWAAEPFSSGGNTYPEGTMIVDEAPGLAGHLEELAEELHVPFEALPEKPQGAVHRMKPLRLGVYKSWTASMDEGWLRWVLEQFEFPYTSVVDRDIREGRLRDRYDVLIIPDMREKDIVEGRPEGSAPPEYCGGIGDAGVDALRMFVDEGGTLITINTACLFAVNSFSLDVADAAAGLDRKEFFIPGSILRVLKAHVHPIAYGTGEDAAVMFRRSPVLSPAEGTGILNYPPDDLLLSGWVNGEEVVFGNSALVEVPRGGGRIILIGFPVHYRGQAHGTFRYLFNAVYYGSAEKP